jgi:hypothetical protein
MKKDKKIENKVEKVKKKDATEVSKNNSGIEEKDVSVKRPRPKENTKKPEYVLFYLLIFGLAQKLKA